MVVLDLPLGFDKVVTSCNILIPCNKTYGLLWSVSLAMECTHNSHFIRHTTVFVLFPRNCSIVEELV